MNLNCDESGNRYNFSPNHSVPLHILHVYNKCIQVGAFGLTALWQGVCTGALEIEFFPIIGCVMRITRGMAYALTGWVTFVDAILNPTFLIGSAWHLFTWHLREPNEKEEKIKNSFSKSILILKNIIYLPHSYLGSPRGLPKPIICLHLTQFSGSSSLALTSHSYFTTHINLTSAYSHIPKGHQLLWYAVMTWLTHTKQWAQR